MHAPDGLDIWDDTIDENKQTRIALENMVKSMAIRMVLSADCSVSSAKRPA